MLLRGQKQLICNQPENLRRFESYHRLHTIMTDLFILGASILFIISIFQYHSLTTYILITLWSVPPIILTLILRKRFTSLVTISKNPRKLPSLKIRDLLIIVPLCVFGWVSVFVIIEIYNQARKDERKYAPWWRLKEYGGKF